MTPRAAWRGVKLALALALCFLRYSLLWMSARLRNRPLTPLQRAAWMHLCGRAVLSAMGIRLHVEGEPPSEPSLIVSNHLSYLDIAVFAAILPCAFVSRHDVEQWPVFGAIATIGETIFIDRASRASAAQATKNITAKIAEDIPVVLFPEGTSTDGSSVQRFHSPLFAPVAEGAIPVVPAAIQYLPRNGSEERDLCWFGDAEFLPHIKSVLAGSNFDVSVRFAHPRHFADRRAAAQQAHAAVTALRNRLTKNG